MIWYQSINCEQLNQGCKNTLVEHMGIEFIEVGDDFIKAQMPAKAHNQQPMGILHGGANVVLGETLASVAANAVVNSQTHYCVGLEINTNHLAAVRTGYVVGVTRPIHIGSSTQVWHFEMHDEQNKKTALGRMTAAVLKRR